MRRGNMLEGIRAGFQAYMQGRQWAASMQTNKLQQEQMGLANQIMRQRQADYMSPEQQRIFEREQDALDAQNRVKVAESVFEETWKLEEERMRRAGVVQQDIDAEKMRRLLALDAEVFKETGLHLAGLYASTGGTGGGTVEQGRVMAQTAKVLESVFGGDVPNDQIASIPIYPEIMSMVASGNVYAATARARVWKALHPFKQGKEGGGEYGTHYLDPQLRGEYMADGQQFYPTYTGSGVEPKGVDPDEYLMGLALSWATDDQLRMAAETIKSFIGTPMGPPVPKATRRESGKYTAFSEYKRKNPGMPEAEAKRRFEYAPPITAKE